MCKNCGVETDKPRASRMRQHILACPGASQAQRAHVQAMIDAKGAEQQQQSRTPPRHNSGSELTQSQNTAASGRQKPLERPRNRNARSQAATTANATSSRLDAHTRLPREELASSEAAETQTVDSTYKNKNLNINPLASAFMYRCVLFCSQPTITSTSYHSKLSPLGLPLSVFHQPCLQQQQQQQRLRSRPLHVMVRPPRLRQSESGERDREAAKAQRELNLRWRRSLARTVLDTVAGKPAQGISCRLDRMTTTDSVTYFTTLSSS